MKLDRNLVHFNNFQRHFMNLNHLNRNLNNMFNFFLNILSNFNIISSLKISSMFFTIPWSLKEINLHKSIFSFILRKDLDRDLVNDGFLPQISSSSTGWRMLCICSVLVIADNSIFDYFYLIVMLVDELLKFTFKITQVIKTKIGCNFFDLS